MTDIEATWHSWHSYPKVYALGHAAIRGIFDDPVAIEEKIDGSQFSFGVFDGDVKVRSKGATMYLDDSEKLFSGAADEVKKILLLLHNGWTYRTEYLAKPKHNTLAYSRVPQNNIIGFDVNTGNEEYLSYEAKREEFTRLGLETVPL